MVPTRCTGESIQVNTPIPGATGGVEPITVTVLGVKGNQVRIGIGAPDDITILREELEECESNRGKWGAC